MNEKIEIDTLSIKKNLGKEVEYKLIKDIDRSGRYETPTRKGILTSIVRKQVDFGNGDYIHFKHIISINLI